MESSTPDGRAELPATSHVRGSSTPRPSPQTRKDSEPNNQQGRDNPLETDESSNRGEFTPGAPDDTRHEPRNQPKDNRPDRSNAKTQDIQGAYPNTTGGKIMAQQPKGLLAQGRDREHDQVTQKFPGKNDRDRLRTKLKNQNGARREEHELEQARHTHGAARDNDP